MGYDFMLMPIRDAASRGYPLSWKATVQEDFEGTLPWAEFRNWLESLGGRPNGPRGIFIDFDDENRIEFQGPEPGEDCQCIVLDMHADWEHAVAAFRRLFELEPNCCVLDEQTGIYYDPKSFEEFVAETSA